MDQSLTRGAAVAAFALGTFTAVGSARAQVAAGAIRPARGDSVVVRVINAEQKVLLDSVSAMMRALDGEAPTSEQFVKMRREIDAMMRALAMSRGMVTGSIMLRTTPEGIRELETRHIKGWIGINTGMAPHEEFADSAGSGYFVRYFKYPEIISVEPNSPAQRAGIIPGDVLLAYDGNDVVNRRIDVGQLLVPDRRMAVTVQREGEAKEFSMVVAKAPLRIQFRRDDQMPFPPMLPGEIRAAGGGVGGAVGRAMAGPSRSGQSDRVVFVGPAGGGGGDYRFMIERNMVFGAVLMNVNAELAQATKLEKGVLVQECPESSAAYRAGLRTGDAIVSVAGQAVMRATEVQSLVSAKRNERSVVFVVTRDKKPVTVTLKW